MSIRRSSSASSSQLLGSSIYIYVRKSSIYFSLSEYIGPFVRMPCTNYYCISSALILFRQTTHKIHRRQTVATVDEYIVVWRKRWLVVAVASTTMSMGSDANDNANVIRTTNMERIWAKRRKTESLDGKFGVVCGVYLSFIEHFIVTKPSLRRSNLIQFDSFHTWTHANRLAPTMANGNSSNNNRPNRIRVRTQSTVVCGDATAKANLSTMAKQTNRKMKRWASNYFTHARRTPSTVSPHTHTRMPQSTINMDFSLMWVACVCALVDCRQWQRFARAATWLFVHFVRAFVCPERRNEGHII